MIKLGIIGCGRVTETVHLPVLRRMAGVDVAAACDIRDDRRKLVQTRFGASRVHSEWSRLLEDPRIDAVLIATPSDSHALLAAAALDAGKHVLVEKPFAPTVADAEILVAKAKASDRVSMVGFNYRFHPLSRSLISRDLREDVAEHPVDQASRRIRDAQARADLVHILVPIT